MFRLKKIIIWLIIILAISAGIFAIVKSRKPKVEYTTEEARRGDLAKTVSVTGTLNPDKMYDLSFKTSGTVEKISVVVGDIVKKNQRLANIDRGELYADLRQAEFERKYQKNTYDNTKLRHGTYNKEQRKAQKALVDKADAAINEIRIEITNTNIFSPIFGIVFKRNFDEGENAAANSAVLTVAAEGDLLIHSDVPESDIAEVALGQRAIVTYDALPSDCIFKIKNGSEG